MNCKICGEPLKAHYKVCPFCGARIFSMGTAVMDSINTPEDDLPLELFFARDKTKSRLILFLGVACALFIASVLFFAVTAEPRKPAPNISFDIAKITPSYPVYPAYNGEIVVYPSYERICPLKIEAGEGMDYLRAAEVFERTLQRYTPQIHVKSI